MVVTEDGLSFAFGWNKHGQLGSGSVKNGGFFFKFCLSYVLRIRIYLFSLTKDYAPLEGVVALQSRIVEVF